MGSKGATLGGILGLIVASIPGAWGVGAFMAFNIGAAVGGMLIPTKAPNTEEGRLSDLRTTGSSQGVPIPTLYGRQRVGTILLYAGPCKEVKVDSGGGGKK